MTKRARFRFILIVALALLTAIVALCVFSIATKASDIKRELTSATQLVASVKENMLSGDSSAAREGVKQMQMHTASARDMSSDPLWTLAASLPWIGQNFQAVSQVASSADDLSRLGAEPLVDIVETLDWKALAPSSQGIDLAPISSAAPKLKSAASAVGQSTDRLDRIDVGGLLPQVGDPILDAREQLTNLRNGLDVAANAASVAPSMMGSQGPRRYLLLIQNNAELRASGGIPGALAVLTFDSGKLSLSDQTNAGGVGIMNPPLTVDSEQQHIYTSRLGKFMQDVNLTPDFPSAASTAAAMWKAKHNVTLDGVISVDPIALSYVLGATGPVDMPEGFQEQGFELLPSKLSKENVVGTLLSQVYLKIESTERQDAYFAGVAQTIFTAISSGRGEATGLIEAVKNGAEEGRIRVWSHEPTEQSVIALYPLSGAIAGPSVSPAEFGVYFNDGTGAKMDYYVKRTVQLVKQCPNDGYEEVTVRVTSTNTAPLDAATSLPPYITGSGTFGVPAGNVQTNVIVYGPVQSNVETAKIDGGQSSFAPYLHAGRPVGVVAVQLRPGESKTVEFNFGKIVQHAEPNLTVTPTVQAVKDVTRAIEYASCG